MEQLVGRRLADDPKDAQTPGHRLLLRGGYIRQVGQGIFSLLPLARRASRKIEQIIREEMNRIGGQEVLMPVVSPVELWEESGRYHSVGPEMLRFEDRTGHPCVLNMTHEELVVDLARGNVDSYRQFPFMLYQIQTKFRDEPRSRAGLIRVREFTMKDAYSFHRTQQDLDEYYQVCHEAYTRIFKRCGLVDFVDIESDTGMMGGNLAHEFMAVSPVGEDTLFLCDSCGYRANREVARTVRQYSQETFEELTEVHTPGKKTIEEVTAFVGTTPQHACKCVAFMGDGEGIFTFVRGDLDVNQAKLKRETGAADIRPMEDEEFARFGTVAGYVGPQTLDPSQARLLFDESVIKSPNLVVGANREDYHLTGFNFPRDLPDAKPADIADVIEGDVCPECRKPLRSARGIEIGNIFQLGKKYTVSMDFQYDEEDGSTRHPIMGCYGIGVGRTLQSIVEESHDDYGPIWPMSVAPFQVQICCLQAAKGETQQEAEKLYRSLLQEGLEVLLDTRKVGAGFMFADADLVGAPVRAIVSPRNLKNGEVELKYRVKNPPEGLPGSASMDTAATVIREAVESLLAAVQL